MSKKSEALNALADNDLYKVVSILKNHNKVKNSQAVLDLVDNYKSHLGRSRLGLSSHSDLMIEKSDMLNDAIRIVRDL